MIKEKTIFISHSSADNNISEKVYQYIENLGVGCWMDKHDIVPGIPYARAIMKGLDMCKAMLVLLSANSIKSDDVLNEIDQAHSENKMLFPMFIENIELPRDFKYYLARRQWIVAYDDLDKGLNELSKAIETNLNIKLIDKEAEEREKKINEAKKDLIRLAEEYHSLGIEQSKLSHKIEDKMRFAGITHRTCPICEASVNLDSSFCPTCGWPISPIYGIEGAEYLLTDKNVQIDLMKSVWNKAGDSSCKEMVGNLKETLNKKDNEIIQLKGVIESLKKKYEQEIEKNKQTSVFISPYGKTNFSSVADVFDFLIANCESKKIDPNSTCRTAVLPYKKVEKILNEQYRIIMPEYRGYETLYSFAKRIYESSRR